MKVQNTQHFENFSLIQNNPSGASRHLPLHKGGFVFCETTKNRFIDTLRLPYRGAYETEKVKMIKYNGNLISRAKELRKCSTPQENHLWYDFLREHPLKFQRQKVVGNYILDFYCNRAKIAIEIDGSQHYEDDGRKYDDRRTEILEKQGIKVLRFSNYEINTSFDEVCENIDYEIKQRI